MIRRVVLVIAGGTLALGMLAGPAAAAGPFDGPADGACVTQGVQSLKGAIGGVASTTPPGTVAAVIGLHLTGEACAE